MTYALITLMAALFITVPAVAAEKSLPDSKVVKLASLNWPPYTSSGLPEQGATVAVLKAAFSEMGYQLQVEFFPWSRAVYLANDEDNEYAGYFPEYFDEAVSKKFIYSESIGNSPLGFVEKSVQPVSWHSLNDLKGLRIGVVKDYVNSADFDRMVDTGELQVSEVVADKLNIRKVAYGRIQLAVIDKNLLNFMLNNDAELQDIKHSVQMNDHLLEIKKLFVCFKRSRPDLAKVLDEGLRRIDVQRLQAEYLANLYQEKKR